jgi:hypothetical protein
MHYIKGQSIEKKRTEREENKDDSTKSLKELKENLSTNK